MYNCWNEALKYLGEKYGTTTAITGSPYLGAKEKQGKALTPNTGIVMATDGKYIDKRSEDDKIIQTLLGQYHYGLQAKKELYFKLVDMGVMEDKENQLRFRHC